MSFFSTRGGSCVTASQAILRGIAPDGGLYVPAMFPPVSLEKIARMADMSYTRRAVEILKLFLEDFSIAEIEKAVLALDMTACEAFPEGAVVKDWSINGVDATLGILR